MSCSYGSRLIWQYTSPAPFEAAWSVFAKLMALNHLKPNRIRSLIATDKHKKTIGDLQFWDGSWIDFSRYSNALGVEENRLRAGFLNQIGFNGFGERGIKICPDCLAKGYLCTFFSLAFIDSCPWHKRKLKNVCPSCFHAVSSVGLSPASDGKLRASTQADWEQWESSCSHISFNEGKVVYANSLSLLEQKVISNYCSHFLKWWERVSHHSGIADHLAQLSMITDGCLETKYLSAAENIAGICPWPTKFRNTTIRSHSWTHGVSASPSYHVPNSRNSDWDITYRAIRRYIERKFVRGHRSCWNELKNLNRIDTYRLDSDTACPVALAYACWRLSMEQFISVEIFNTGIFRNMSIQIRTLEGLEIEPRLETHAALTYAHFLYIWDELIRHLGTNSIEIYHQSWCRVRDDFAVMSKRTNPDDGGEWTIILPNYNHLANLSFLRCCGRIKKSGWMIYPWGRESWLTNLEYSRFPIASYLFRLKRNPYPRHRISFRFIGV